MKNERVIAVHNSQYIVLPPWKLGQSGWQNLKVPDLSVPDAGAAYPIGSRFVDFDKQYVYVLAGGTLNPDMGAKNAYTQSVAYAAIKTASAQYATTVCLTAGATDGIAANGVIAANALAGGHLVIFPHSSNTFTRRIISNGAATSGTELAIVIDQPAPYALVATDDHGECMACEYINIQTLTSATTSVVGVPTYPLTSGQYGWLQTWGPSWIAPQAAVSVGNNNRLCIFRHDGSIDELDYSDANNSKGQIAGYVMANAYGAGQGAPFVFLMISRI